MPEAVTSGNLYLYADDATVYCIGSTVDEACNLLDNALDEINKWCITNSLKPHPSKCEVILLHRRSLTGLHTLWLPLVTLTLHGMSRKVAGYYHSPKPYMEETSHGIKVLVCCKLNLLKLKCSFLMRKSLLDLYFKVFFPSVTYGISIWENCGNMNYIKTLRALHCRAGRIILIYHGIHYQKWLWNLHNGTRSMICLN